MILTIVCVGIAITAIQLFTVGLVIHLGNELHVRQEDMEAKVDKLTAIDSKFDSLIEQMR